MTSGGGVGQSDALRDLEKRSMPTNTTASREAQVRAQALVRDFSFVLRGQRTALMGHLSDRIRAKRSLLRFSGVRGKRLNPQELERRVLKAAEEAGLRRPKVGGIQQDSFDVEYFEARLTEDSASKHIKEYGRALHDLEEVARNFYAFSLQTTLSMELSWVEVNNSSSREEKRWNARSPAAELPGREKGQGSKGWGGGGGARAPTSPPKGSMRRIAEEQRAAKLRADFQTAVKEFQAAASHIKRHGTGQPPPPQQQQQNHKDTKLHPTSMGAHSAPRASKLGRPPSPQAMLGVTPAAIPQSPPGASEPLHACTCSSSSSRLHSDGPHPSNGLPLSPPKEELVATSSEENWSRHSHQAGPSPSSAHALHADAPQHEPLLHLDTHHARHQHAHKHAHLHGRVGSQVFNVIHGYRPKPCSVSAISLRLASKGARKVQYRRLVDDIEEGSIPGPHRKPPSCTLPTWKACISFLKALLAHTLQLVMGVAASVQLYVLTAVPLSTDIFTASLSMLAALVQITDMLTTLCVGLVGCLCTSQLRSRLELAEASWVPCAAQPYDQLQARLEDQVMAKMGDLIEWLRVVAMNPKRSACLRAVSRCMRYSRPRQLRIYVELIALIRRTPAAQILAQGASASSAVAAFGISATASLTPVIVFGNAVFIAALVYCAVAPPMNRTHESSKGMIATLGLQLRNSPLKFVSALVNLSLALDGMLASSATWHVKWERLLLGSNRGLAQIGPQRASQRLEQSIWNQNLRVFASDDSLQREFLGLLVATTTLCATSNFVRRAVRTQEFKRFQNEEDVRLQAVVAQQRALQNMSEEAMQDHHWLRPLFVEALPSLVDELDEMAKHAKFHRPHHAASLVIAAEHARRLISRAARMSRELVAQNEGEKEIAWQATMDADENTRRRQDQVAAERMQEAKAALRAHEADEQARMAMDGELIAKDECSQAREEADRKHAQVERLSASFSVDLVDSVQSAAAERRAAALEAEQVASAQQNAIEQMRDEIQLEQQALAAKAERLLELSSKSLDEASEASDMAEKQAEAVRAAQMSLDEARNAAASLAATITEKERECDELIAAAEAKKNAAQASLHDKAGAPGDSATVEFTLAASSAEAAARELADHLGAQLIEARDAETAAARGLLRSAHLELKQRGSAENEATDALQSATLAHGAQTARLTAAENAIARVPEISREMALASGSIVAATSAKEAADMVERMANVYKQSAARSSQDAVLASEKASAVSDAMSKAAMASTAWREAAAHTMQCAKESHRSRVELEAAAMGALLAAQHLAEWMHMEFDLDRLNEEVLRACAVTQKQAKAESDAVAREDNAKEEALHVQSCSSLLDEQVDNEKRLASTTEVTGHTLTNGAQVHRTNIDAQVMRAEAQSAHTLSLHRGVCRGILQLEATRAKEYEESKRSELQQMEDALREPQEHEETLALREMSEQRAHARAEADEGRCHEATLASHAARVLSDEATNQLTSLIQASADAAVLAIESAARATCDREELEASQNALMAMASVGAEPAEAAIEAVAQTMLPNLETVASEAASSISTANASLQAVTTDVANTRKASQAVEVTIAAAQAALDSAASEAERAKDAVISARKRLVASTDVVHLAIELVKQEEVIAAANDREMQMNALSEAAIETCLTETVHSAVNNAVAKVLADENLIEVELADEDTKLLEEAAKLAAAEATQKSAEAARREAMAGYSVGDVVFHHDITRVRRDGKRLLYGAKGTVLDLVEDQVLAVRFIEVDVKKPRRGKVAQDQMDWHCPASNLSYAAAPSLAGGYEVGEQVYLHPHGKPFADGPVPEGEIVGLPGPFANSRDHLEQMVAVRIVATEESVRTAEDDVRACYVSWLRRTKPPVMPSEPSQRDSYRRSGSVKQ